MNKRVCLNAALLFISWRKLYSERLTFEALRPTSAITRSDVNLFHDPTPTLDESLLLHILKVKCLFPSSYFCCFGVKFLSRAAETSYLKREREFYTCFQIKLCCPLKTSFERNILCTFVDFIKWKVKKGSCAVCLLTFLSCLIGFSLCCLTSAWTLNKD